MPDAKVPNLHGDGTAGYRLWMRSVDDTWIEVPYGAGQDYSVRSLNIWDAKAKKWRVPVNGWSVRLRGNNADSGIPDREIDSLNFYAPGRTWVGGEVMNDVLPFYNPNYSTRRAADVPFSPMSPKWIRLFHLMDRPDPNWRIVPLGIHIPRIVGNRTINWDTSVQPDTTMFWPNTSATFRRINHGFDGSTTTTTDIGPGNANSLSSLASLNPRYDPLDSLNPPAHYSYVLDQSAGLIDLRAILERLSDDFPQQQVDYAGQYNDISTQAVKRVIAHGTVALQFSAGGINPPGGLFNSAVATIYASTYIPATTPTSATVGNETYAVRSPGSVVGGGAILFQKPISELAFTSFTTTDPTSSTGYFYTIAVVDNTEVTYTWENPGEDSVGCYASITGLPGVPNTYNWSALVNFTPTRVAIHYASAGHDVPAAKRVWDAIT